MNVWLMNGIIKREELNRSQNSSKFNLEDCTNFVPRRIFLANNSYTNSLANSTNSVNLQESNCNFVKLFAEERKEQRVNTGVESEEEFELFVKGFDEQWSCEIVRVYFSLREQSRLKFTSPIRRFRDVLTHKLIDYILAIREDLELLEDDVMHEYQQEL